MTAPLLPSAFWLLTFFAAALGAIVGSFLNVVIHRYPREESIVFPPSHCPHCSVAIRWYDNFPILSYLVLRARCRACRGPISIRYPLVELANALFYLAIFLYTGPTFGFLLLAAIVSITIVLIYIDAEFQFLPDVVDIPGIVIGIGLGAMNAGVLYPNLLLSETLIDSLIGAAFGAGLIIAITATYWLVRRVEGMGQGDIKMMAMIGAVVGWRALLGVMLLASIMGAIVGLAAAPRSARGMQLALPFGVFLGMATLAVIFFGHTLTEWYLALVPN